MPPVAFSRRAAADLRLRQRGQWGRQVVQLTVRGVLQLQSESSTVTHSMEHSPS
jgi:hypothetical protein